jgi:hypothetical protein
MKSAPRPFLVVSALALALVPAASACAQIDIGTAPGDKWNFPQAWEDFQTGWLAFAEWRFLLQLVVELVLAAFLSALIAWHPKSYGKASTLDELEQPKTFIMYAVVAAVTANIVLVLPAMALVVFGIGGLLRFRTDVGPAKYTGRVILVTMACGLNLFPLAVLGTAFGWVLVFLLESRITYRIVIKGLEKEQLDQASDVYLKVLEKKRCSVISHKKNFIKGQFNIVFRAPASLGREDLEEIFHRIPKELRGSVDWETT